MLDISNRQMKKEIMKHVIKASSPASDTNGKEVECLKTDCFIFSTTTAFNQYLFAFFLKDEETMLGADFIICVLRKHTKAVW